ncbi:hypothetical protein MKX01_037315, partial [Papaver californicum]
RTIPGSYRLPLIGPISDRLDYFWLQGPQTFFKKRMEEHKSSFFRANVPPRFPLFAFAHLFDMYLVEKKNILIGDFMPSVSFTSNMRVCVYLDTTKPQHSQVKSFAAHILKRSSSVWVSEFISNLDIMWGKIEKEVTSNGSSSFLFPLQKCMFRFLTKSLFVADPTKSSDIDEKGHEMLDKCQEETIHNLLFILGFNAFGGFSVFIPFLLISLGGDKPGCFTGSSSLSFSSVKETELVNSFVYESLRFSPPVPFQYARARKDCVLSSYDSVSQIKKGELLYPKVFDNPEMFVADRFTKEKGQELLNYLSWSNGPQTGTPATSNKQCSAKDIVVLNASLLVADVLTRYNSFTVSSGSVKAVEKAK